MMYSEYQASGQTVGRWWAEKNLITKTFYYRFRKLREAAIKQEQHEIVARNNSFCEQNSYSDNSEIIRISGRGITAELPKHISPELLTVLLKEAKFEQVYIVCGYTDMWRSIDGLAGIVKQNFGLEPCSGSLFLFCGKGVTE